MGFYEFSQNNSGGSFDVDETVCHRVFIEADSADLATEKAIGLGVYFDGCESGRDCPCCGDRWYALFGDDDAIDFPVECRDVMNQSEKVIAKNIEEYAQCMADYYGWTAPDARIFYSNGTVKEIFEAS